ncbi:amino acid adenylation domain-containing protein, partial [Nocardia sp. CWNU-33]|uniref:amino acid adenylation domain-containing protein n=1 Tax=Nocardia sp. CWNU-33 TaxID=3392117 RepID=UPI00398EB349
RRELVAGPRPERIPLSLAQQRMWFLNRFDTESAAYNVPIAVRMTGALDVAALRAAVADLVGRHEILRTIYPETESGPVQVILTPAQARSELDVRVLAPQDIESAVVALASTIFDVTIEVPLRVALFEIEDSGDAQEYVLAMVVHHISGDGSSVGPLTRDLMVAYAARAAGEAPNWAPLAVQYADYSIWQREVLGSEDDPESLATKQIAYWRDALAELPDQLDLPSDRPRPAVQSFVGGKVEMRIDAATHQALMELARAESATLFMVVHTAFAVLLARLSGTDDIAIGTPIAGRGEAALDDLIGMFVNTLVFRSRVEAGEPFTELLARQRETDIQTFANADVPFERLVEVLNPVRSTARHPLFQVGLSFQNLAKAGLELPELTVAGLDIDTALSQFDLHLIASDGYNDAGEPQGIAGVFTYASDLFDRETVQGFADRFARLLGAIIASPRTAVGDIEFLDHAERAELTVARNATEHEVDSAATLVGLLDASVAVAPQRVALVSDDGSKLTYGELDARVNRLARHLISLGVGPESRVALALRRSVDLVVAMYAVAKAGGAYVPVDPDQPAERTDYILATAGPVCVLTNAEAQFSTDVAPLVSMDALGDLDDAPITDADRVAPLRPEHTAYVIFTSGSTGRPKGVAVPHAAIVNQLLWKTAEFGLDAADAVLLKTAATFDLSVWEFWSAAVCGGRLVIAAPDGHRDPAYLNELIARESVTTLHVVPSMLDALLTMGLSDSLRRVLAIGEALPGALAQRFLRDQPGTELFNLYGPTEAAVSITSHRVTGQDLASVSIGVPEWNSRVYVLDARLNPVPTGVSGELYLAGAQLARGYFGRTDLTADRFVANPFESGTRMYRTGDLVAWNGNGELEYRGRTDFQVKIRGFRIELGEIEAALLALPEIAQTAVLAKSDPKTGDRLVAYLVASSGDIDVAQVKSALAAGLPSYMVPSAFVVLDALPLNVNGKLDRKALPEPEFEAQVFRAPSTPIEEIVASVFAEVLGVERVGVDDDFFALGGNSLLATHTVARIGAALDAQVPVRRLFEASTVAGLAVKVEQDAGAGGRKALVAGPRPERIPLSLAQQRMWFLNRFDTESAAYNVPVAVRLTGELDVEALRQAIADVVARHEILRTMYPEIDDAPVQVILPVAQAIPQVTVTVVAPGDIESTVRAFMSATFDVTTEVPLRVALFEIEDSGDAQEYVLAMVVHHISGDGSSVGPLTRDLMVAYAARSAGEAPNWAPLAVQYADYSIWQREVLGSEDDPDSLVAKQIAHWQQTLAGLPDQLDLPVDHPRPAVQSFAGGKVEVRVDAQLHRALTDLARAEGATLFMVVHTALAVLLARLSGTDDIAIGTPIAGRGEAVLDDMIGMFVNTLVFRTTVDAGEPFTGLLARQRETDIQAFANAEVPFERLVDVLNPERSTARHPLFQVGLSFQNLAGATLELMGLKVAGLDIDAQLSQFDLHLIVTDGYDADGNPAGIGGYFTYATDLFDQATVQGFADRFLRVLREIAATPRTSVGDIEVLDAAERAGVVTAWNATEHEVDAAATLVSLLDATVAATPDAVALIGDESAAEPTVLTYAELDARVNRLARYLIGRGVGPEDRVALAIRRSVDLVVAMYAVAKSGAAYVPIDPDQPAERTEYILDTAVPVCVLTTSRDGFTAGAVESVRIDAVDLAGHAADPIVDAERVAPLRPEHTAYVIFTSGSTGRPKGVAVPHGAIVNQLSWKTAEFALSADDAVLLKTAATFDLSVWEFWSAAVSGGRLVIAVPDGHQDPAYLNALMARESVTTLHVVPSMLDALLIDSGDTLADSLRRVLAIGEGLPPATAQRFRRNNSAQLWNLYGPTEAAVSITSHGVTDADQVSVSIGAPEWNSQVYVLDARLRPVPVGVSGELYLAGAQLARGYFGQPNLTADRFVANPFQPGTRMYRTGDLVAWTADGELDYRGRTDFQVKIRGFRIELGEIEVALLRQPEITAAAVVAHNDANLGDRLVGYIVAGSDAVDTRDLESRLAAELPSYMVPSVFVQLDALPLNVNGKLDRKALPQPVFEQAEFRAPATPTERIVADVFSDVLGVERVGADDDFFALGGNSILSIQLVSRAKVLGVVFSVREVFEQRSVVGLASIARSAAVGPVRLPELPGGGVGAIALPPSIAAVLANGADYQRRSQATTLRLPAVLDRTPLIAAITAVLEHHDALRTRLRRVEENWVFEALDSIPDIDELVHEVSVDSVVVDDAELSRIIDAERAAAADRLDPANAVMAQFVRLCFADEERGDELLVVAHRFAVDSASLRILMSDLAQAVAQVAAGLPVALPSVGTSLRRWAHSLADEATDRSAELPFWQEVSATPDPLLGSRAFDPAIDTAATVQRVQVELPTTVTDSVLTAIPELYRASVTSGLLSALAIALVRWRGQGNAMLVRLEADGRDAVSGAELSRTIGAFATAYPFRFDLADADLDNAFTGGIAVSGIVKTVKEQLLAVPDHGAGHSLLALQQVGQVGFRYRGLPSITVTSETSADAPANAAVDIEAHVIEAADGPKLAATFAFPAGLLGREQVQELADLWVAAVTALAEHTQRPDAGGLTPSDMPLVQVGQADIERWEQAYPGLEEVWPVSPLQSGLLFHALMTAATVDVYTMQAVVHLSGTVQGDRLHASAQAILDRYPNLRTAFVSGSDGQAMQVVVERLEVPWREVDLTGLPEAEQAEELRRQLAADRATKFDMSVAPLVRYTLFRTGAEQWHMAIATHHVLLDGWSMPLLLRDLLVLYATRGDLAALPQVSSYRSFLDWLAERDVASSLRTWAQALDGVGEPTELAPPSRSVETYETRKLSTEIDAERTRRLTKHCAELGITVNTLVQAAWGILLGRLTGRDDVVFGATVSGRPAELPGVESMVGLFINTLPVRVRVDDHSTIDEQLKRLQRDQADLLDHHYVGLTDIQGVAGPGAQFDTLVVFESYPVDREAIAAASSIDGMSVTDVSVESAAHYPLTLQVNADSTIEFTLEYLTSRFSADEVETLSARLIRVLEALLGDPAGLVGAIDILDSSERTQLLAESGIGAAAATQEPVGRVGARTVAKVLAEVVEADPEAPALLVDGDEIAYHVLDRRSSQLARVLIDRGAGPGDIVAVALPRSVDAVVAAWAVQKAGAACLFAPSVAEIENAGAGFGITLEPAAAGAVHWLVPSDPQVQTELASAPSHPVSYSDRVRPLADEHPAFVVLVNGAPVVLSQAEALDRAAQVREEYGIDYESTTFTTAAAGQAAMLEFLTAATAGALSVLPSGGDLADDLADGEVTHWFVVPGESTDAADAEIRIVVAE